MSCDVSLAMGSVSGMRHVGGIPWARVKGRLGRLLHSAAVQFETGAVDTIYSICLDLTDPRPFSSYLETGGRSFGGRCGGCPNLDWTKQVRMVHSEYGRGTAEALTSPLHRWGRGYWPGCRQQGAEQSAIKCIHRSSECGWPSRDSIGDEGWKLIRIWATVGRVICCTTRGEASTTMYQMHH